MTGSVGTQGQVVIDEAIRAALGIAPGWIAVQRLVDNHVEIRFLPPDHGESLKGSLASHTTVTVSGDEWPEARERAWRDAARERERFPA